MAELCLVERFYHKLLKEEQAQYAVLTSGLQKEIQSLRDRQFEQLSEVRDVFVLQRDHIASLNNVQLYNKLDNIDMIPLVYKLESELQEKQLLIDELFERSSVQDKIINFALYNSGNKQEIKNYETFLTVTNNSAIEVEDYQVQELTSEHYQNLINDLQVRLTKLQQNNQVLSHYYINSEENCGKLQRKNSQIEKQLTELKAQLVEFQDASTGKIRELNENVLCGNLMNQQLIREANSTNEKLAEQSEALLIANHKLDDFQENELQRVGLMVNAAKKQRDGEYARLFSEFKTCADDCKLMVAMQNWELMKQEDLNVELRLKIISLFKKHGIIKEKLEIDVENEFVLLQQQLQQENDELKQKVFDLQDDALRKMEEINMLEQIKKTLTSQNINISEEREQLEEESRSESQTFIEECAKSNLLRRKLKEELELNEQITQERNYLLEENEQLARNFEFALQEYEKVIKAYQVQLLEQYMSNGKPEAVAIAMTNKVMDEVDELLNTQASESYEKDLKVTKLVDAELINNAKNDRKLLLSEINNWNATDRSKVNEVKMQGAQEQKCRSRRFCDAVDRVEHAASSNLVGTELHVASPEEECVKSNLQVEQSAEEENNDIGDAADVPSNKDLSINDFLAATNISNIESSNLYSEQFSGRDREQRSQRRALSPLQMFSSADEEIECFLGNELVATKDSCVQVDDAEISLVPVSFGDELAAKYIPEEIIKKASLMFSPNMYERLFQDKDFSQLPVENQLQAIQSIESERLASIFKQLEVTEDACETDDYLMVNLQKSIASSSRVFNPIPYNQYSRACITELPNISYSIDKVALSCARFSMQELIDLDAIQLDKSTTDLVSTESFEPEWDAGTQTELQESDGEVETAMPLNSVEGQNGIEHKSQNENSNERPDEEEKAFNSASTHTASQTALEQLECSGFIHISVQDEIVPQGAVCEIANEQQKMEDGIEFARKSSNLVHQAKLGYFEQLDCPISEFAFCGHQVMHSSEYQLSQKENEQCGWKEVQKSTVVNYEQDISNHADKAKKKQDQMINQIMTENYMLKFDLQKRTEQLYYYEHRATELQEIVNEPPETEQLQAKEEEVEEELAQHREKCEKEIYHKYEERMRQYENLVLALGYVSRYIYQLLRVINVSAVLEEISSLNDELNRIEYKYLEYSQIQEKKEQECKILVQLLQQYANQGNIELERMFNDPVINGTLVSLCANQDSGINIFIPELSTDGMQTENIAADDEMCAQENEASSSGEQNTRDGGSVNRAESEESGKERDNKTTYRQFREKSTHSVAVENSANDRTVVKMKAVQNNLFLEVREEAHEILVKDEEILSLKESYSMLKVKIEELTDYFANHSRDIDKEKISELETELLYKDQQIMYLQNEVQTLTEQKTTSEKAIDFMFGEQPFTPYFDGCIFKPSRMSNETNSQ